MTHIAANERELLEFVPERDFFVGFDSDGSVFDAMDIKHKECFIPNTINAWGLQPVARAARETHEFVNLYSKWRGSNRWKNIVRTLDLLREHPDVKKRHFVVPNCEGLRGFVNSGLPLNDAGLYMYMKEHDEADLRTGMQWSLDINSSIERIVHGLTPFPSVKESMEKLKPSADLACVSGTRNTDLTREWTYADILYEMELLCGQEVGNKETILHLVAQGKYPDHHVLLIGDSPADYEAAVATHTLFFPINPDHEEESWERFYHEGIDKFLADTFFGAYQDQLVGQFWALLPEKEMKSAS